MLPRSRALSSEHGTVLVQAIVAVAVLTVVMLGALQLNLVFKSSAADDSLSELSLQYLSESLTSLRNSDFIDLANYCQRKNILNEPPHQGACLLDNHINSAGSSDAFALLYKLEQPLDANGQISLQGGAPQGCIEIVQCRPLAGGHLLELRLSQYYWSANQHRVIARSRMMRRSKW